MTVEYRKDPDEVLDYGLDMSAQLAADDDDTIISATMTVEPAEDTPTLTIGTVTTTTTSAKAFFTGGTLGSDYWISCKMTTAGDRVYDRGFVMKIRRK